MTQNTYEKNSFWLILPIVASFIEFALWIFLYFPVLVGGDARKSIVIVAHLAFLFYPLWLLIAFVFHIFSYRQGNLRRVKLVFGGNILYLLALIVLALLTLLFGLYR